MTELETLDLSSEATCITEHPGFSGVCLDMWVQQTAAHQICHTHGQDAIARAGPTHKYVTSRPLSAFCKLHFALLHHTVGNTTTSRIDSRQHGVGDT